MNLSKKTEILQNRVKYLLDQHKTNPILQRSPEWFELRNIAISASEIASCLTNTEEICRPYINEFNIENFKIDNKCCSHFDTKEDFIINKCKTFNGINVFKDSVFTLWGKKYEEIATRFYRQYCNTAILEFGSIEHPTLNWLRASPDGITPDGKMLEIKCPYSRKINGIVPFHYFQQMQLQMFCAELEECDFLECEITELEDVDSFINYNCVEFHPGHWQQKGIMINLTDKENNSESKYIYPPDRLVTTNDFINWSNNCILELGVVKINAIPIYYTITKWNIILVKILPDWINTIIPILKDTHLFFRNLQENPILASEYENVIYLKKNKKFIEKQNNTICLFDSDSETDFENDFENEICLLSD